jgi:hypothetical protein
MGKTAGWSSQWQSQHFRPHSPRLAGRNRGAPLLANRAVRDKPLGSTQPRKLQPGASRTMTRPALQQTGGVNPRPAEPAKQFLCAVRGEGQSHGQPQKE